MIRSLVVASLVAMSGWPMTACSQGDAARATTAAAAYRSGEYDNAIRLANAAIREDSTSASNAVLLIRALTDIGKADDAIIAGESLSKRPALQAGVAYRLGDRKSVV